MAQLHRAFCFAASVAFTLLVLPSLSRAGTWVAFQSSYTRGTGAPVTATNTFTLLNPSTQYTLKAFNGGLQNDTSELVSYSVVYLNGAQVVGPANFNQNVAEVDVMISPGFTNTLSIQVRGKPGGVLTIQVIGVDNDPPTITASVSPSPNAAGWNNSPVTITFACSDKTSGVASCSSPIAVNTEGANQVFSGTATDLAGNTASGSVTINLDMTPPTITGNINPPPDAGGYNGGPVSLIFACADALSGVASCSPTVTDSTEGTNTLTRTAVDVAGNTASTTVTVNISRSYFKIRSWQTGPNGNAKSPSGKCLDYAPYVGGAVFLNDCSPANPIRVVEVSVCANNPNGPPICGPRTGSGGTPLTHEVMLFAGSLVIGIHNPSGSTLSGTSTPLPPATEYSLELQVPWNAPNANALYSSPANQIFRLDGDSIILEGSHVELQTTPISLLPPVPVEVPGPCINTVASTTLCPPPPPQLVIHVQNARGANGSPLVAAVRNLADNEFWDFVLQPGSRPYPTNFISTVAPPGAPLSSGTPITTNWQLWNAICSSPQADPTQTPPAPPASECSAYNIGFGWGSVVVITSPNNDCHVTDPVAPGESQDIGACIDLSTYPPIALPAGATIRGSRRATDFGAQLYAGYLQEGFNSGLCANCIVDFQGDYGRVTGLRLRGQSRSTDTIKGLFKTDGVWIDYAAKNTPLAPPCVPIPPSTVAPPCAPQNANFPLATVDELIATVDHNDMSDWMDAAITANAPFSVSSSRSTQCQYVGFYDMNGGQWYRCDQNNGLVPPPGSPPYPPQSLGDVPVSNDPATLANIRVARNFLHHNERNEGGYGVAMGNQGGRVLIEGNTFSWNRHDITGSGEPHSEYRASHNLVLSSAANYPFGGNNQRLQDFDMHGTDWVSDSLGVFNSLYIGGAAGFYVEIDGNTFLGNDGAIGGAGRDYRLRGYPVNSTYYHDNRTLRNEDQAMEWDHCFSSILGLFGCSAHYPDSDFLTHITISGDNQFASSSPQPYTDPTRYLGVGDFDGDGDDDLFLATGNTWFYSPAGAREWRYLNSAPDTIDQLLFGDFDGDGRTDVVGMRNGQLFVSWGGISAFEPLNSSVPANCTMADLAVGDFDGDGKPDIFCADWQNNNWWISYGGTDTFTVVNHSIIQRKDLRFGDFNRDGQTDVFSVQSSGWQVSYGATSQWMPLGGPSTSTADGLVVADFNGDGFADVGSSCGSGGWQISYGGTQGWSTCDSFTFSLVGGGVGHFSGGSGADILVWNSNDISVVPGGTGSPVTLSSQDMR